MGTAPRENDAGSHEYKDTKKDSGQLVKGRVVFYYEDAAAEPDTAIVVRVNEDTTVNLSIFRNETGQVAGHTCVPFTGEIPDGGGHFCCWPDTVIAPPAPAPAEENKPA